MEDSPECTGESGSRTTERGSPEMANGKRSRGRRRNRRASSFHEETFLATEALPAPREERQPAGPLFHRVLPMGFGLEETGETGSALALASPESTELTDTRPETSAETGLELEHLGSRMVQSQREMATHIGHLHRQITDLESLQVRRGQQERREAWMLAGGIAVVLAFCFAAFYMNQVQVKELEDGLGQEIRDTSQMHTARLGRTLQHLHQRALPELKESLEQDLARARLEGHARLNRLGDELAALREQSTTKSTESRQALEHQSASLARLEGELKDLLASVDDLRKAHESHQISRLDDDGLPPVGELLESP